MCKIVAFTNAKKLDVKKSSEAIGNILLDIERDGFGYAVQGEQNVFGERCTADKFVSRLHATNVINLPIVEIRQASFGYLDKPRGPALFHGRTSTNDKGLINCHPMVKDNWTLIHNGVVDDNGPEYSKVTTNDSEDLLHRLILGIDHVEKDLSGYYAFCAIDPMGRLHVARDSMATLYMAECPKLSSYIIGTTEELIENVAKALKIKLGPIDKIKDNVYMIFDGNTLIHSQTIKPRGYDSRQLYHANASLGRVIDASEQAEQAAYNSWYDRDDRTTADDLMREIACMDDHYQIEHDGELITVAEYHKLDEVSKLECIIQRPDGTWLDIEGYWNIA